MQLNTEHITEDHRFWNKVNALAKEAFPPEEYLAPSKLVEMAKADNFDFLALSDKESFVGFMVVQTYKNLAYLFFLAIDSSCRSKGYGTRAVETLKAEYPNKKHIVDFEMLDDTSSNNEQRAKRREFYLGNGYKETGLFLSYLGVDYEVFCMNDDFEPDEFKAMMKTIRVDGFNPQYFERLPSPKKDSKALINEEVNAVMDEAIKKGVQIFEVSMKFEPDGIELISVTETMGR